MTSRRTIVTAIGCSGLGLLLGGCETAALPPVTPGYAPAPNTDEAGLWRLMDKAEEEIRYSKFLVRDDALNRYLSSVACRVGERVCSNIRVYLTRAPYFNASMAPNGMMQIWTGLLLRVADEAELAAVIGHEIGHYVKRHALERWRTAKATLAASNVAGMGLGVAGAGVLSQLPGIIAVASILAYTREQEREADAIGFELMTRAGYYPMAAADVWDALIEETSADPNPEQRDLFLSTHPAPEERRETLRRLAAGSAAGVSNRGRKAYLEQTARIRSMLLSDEVELRQPERSLVVLGRLRREEPDDPELAYFEAEVLRLRGKTIDLRRAEALLEKAVETGAPAQAWRSLGIIRRNRGADDLAAVAFRRYLEMEPSAPDAPLIRGYVERRAR